MQFIVENDTEYEFLCQRTTLAMLAEDKIEITLIRFLLAIVAINRFETIINTLLSVAIRFCNVTEILGLLKDSLERTEFTFQMNIIILFWQQKTGGPQLNLLFQMTYLILKIYGSDVSRKAVSH